jgi:hypothetical protein
MKTKRRLLTFITLVAIVTLISFAHLASAQRGRAFVAHTANATAPDDSFSPKDHVIYCIVDAPNAKPNATYKFVWGRHDPAHSSPQTIFQEEVTYQSGNRVVSKFSSSDDLPAGDYSVNVWAPASHMRAAFTVK